MIFIIGGVVLALLFLTITMSEARGINNLEEKVRLFSDAIAFAEGYWDRNHNVNIDSVPSRFNNPGDLGPGDSPAGYPSDFRGGSHVVRFPTVAEGWNYLHVKIRRIFEGRSTVYSVDGSILQMGLRYAGDSANWSRNVAFYLNVDVNITLRRWLET